MLMECGHVKDALLQLAVKAMLYVVLTCKKSLHSMPITNTPHCKVTSSYQCQLDVGGDYSMKNGGRSVT